MKWRVKVEQLIVVNAPERRLVVRIGLPKPDIEAGVVSKITLEERFYLGWTVEQTKSFIHVRREHCPVIVTIKVLPLLACRREFRLEIKSEKTVELIFPESVNRRCAFFPEAVIVVAV